MPRKPRFFLPGVPVHAVQRGVNKSPIFFEDFDYQEYLKFLKQESDKAKCSVHAYVLMTNHVHLLLTPENTNSISELFQGIGRHYVPYINKKYQRTGGLWEGRFKASIIDSENYLFGCMRYIELNPVRAKMVEKPEAYRWSSYRANAQGEHNAILSPHEEYLRLSKNQQERATNYKAMFTDQMTENMLGEIRLSCQSGVPLGSKRFVDQIEKTLGQKVGYSRRGRPRKEIINYGEDYH